MKIRKRNKKRKIDQEILNSINCKRFNDAPVEFFPTGCTVLNMSLCGHKDNGLPRARIINIVGDGSSGKTALALEIGFNFLKYIPTIKSNIFPIVKKVRLKYNNREGVLDFPLGEMYGNKFKNKIEFIISRYMENVGTNIIRTINKVKEGESILYIVDSWDSFPSIAESKRFHKSVKNDSAIEGSFNKEKNTYAQSLFKEIAYLLENNKKDFTLIIISQTREKIGITFGKKKYRTGGAALDFYTHLAIWLREIEVLSKIKNKEERPYAITSEAKVERSKVWKPFRKAKFRILFDYGIDNIGSIITYLKDRNIKKWKDFPLKDPQKFIMYVEKNNLEDELKSYIYKTWKKIERRFEKEIECRKKKEL